MRVAWFARTVRMSSRRASTSSMIRTRCSWVSFQYASKQAVRSSTESSKIVEGLIGSFSWDSYEVWMGGCLASVTLGVDREAKPGLILSKLVLIQGFIARVIHRFGSWYTWLVALYHNYLNRVYPRLIVFQGHPGLLA